MNILPSLSKTNWRRLAYASAAIAVAISFGATGFYLIEGFSVPDSFYLATQTVTTVGYGDIAPVTPAGRIFAIALMLGGGGTVLYSLTVLAQAVIQSEIFEAFGAGRRTREMEKLENHYIVCGAGRVGRRIIRALKKEKCQFILIERDEKKTVDFANNGTHIINGDATMEETLLRAGVKRAKGLAACLADDADNVYVVLTARGLNNNMHIVARAVEEQAEPKLIRAGASRVVAPTIIGSQSMARALLKPAIADFMDSIVAENLDLVFEEVAIDADSPYAGRQLRETNINRELNLIVVAIRQQSGAMFFHPMGETRIGAGDLLIVIGKAEAVAKLVSVSK